ncbi:hypothetical protein [Nocardia sp. NPDC046763]|uniref:hypothetical protein n=1 Tax=Nocardia sp. NPDC046763 TaxID=3155256 RepID=UPI0033F8FFE3
MRLRDLRAIGHHGARQRERLQLAIEAAQAHVGRPGSTTAEMARKITAALDAAGAATAVSGAVSAVAAAQDRPELRKAIEEIVDSGFVGVSVRVRDERGEWVGSAGVAELGGTATPPIDGHVRIASNTKTFTAALVPPSPQTIDDIVDQIFLPLLLATSSISSDI